MKVLIASRNPVKIRAVETAFSLQFPERTIDFEACNMASGVSEQPRSDDETRRGARNRAKNTCKQYPRADFWVGLEDGIETID